MCRKHINSMVFPLGLSSFTSLSPFQPKQKSSGPKFFSLSSYQRWVWVPTNAPVWAYGTPCKYLISCKTRSLKVWQQHPIIHCTCEWLRGTSPDSKFILLDPIKIVLQGHTLEKANWPMAFNLIVSLSNAPVSLSPARPNTLTRGPKTHTRKAAVIYNFPAMRKSESTLNPLDS